MIKLFPSRPTGCHFFILFILHLDLGRGVAKAVAAKGLRAIDKLNRDTKSSRKILAEEVMTPYRFWILTIPTEKADVPAKKAKWLAEQV